MLKWALGPVIKGVGDIIDSVHTSEEEKLSAELELRKVDLEAYKLDTELVTGQQEINKVEAAHPSIFVAGWRPGIGWVGVAALTYQFILHPFMSWIWVFAQSKMWVPFDLPPPPLPSTEMLMTLITGMLGIGGLRSWDKYAKTDTRKVSG